MSVCRPLARALRPLAQHRRFTTTSPCQFRPGPVCLKKFYPGGKTNKIPLLQNPDDWNVQQRPLPGLIQLEHAERIETPVYIAPSWLRDACPCPTCVDPFSGQKKFATFQVPEEPKVREVERLSNGALRVVWDRDFFTGGEHVSEYPPEAVQAWMQHNGPTFLPEPEGNPELWDADALKAKHPFYSHEAFMNDGKVFEEAVGTLRSHGLFFLQGVPRNETEVEHIAAKLGCIQETFYGRTWDVKSKPEAENVAYTSSFLGLHQDLLYMNNIPKLQILHCLDNNTTGGEALFSDGARAAEQMWFGPDETQSDIRELLKIPITYSYNKGGHRYERARKAIHSRGLNWSPPFQSLMQQTTMLRDGTSRHAEWLNFLKRLASLIEFEPFVFKYSYQPGDCVVFDNRRVLHGRNQFDSASGARWLKGTYVDLDSYHSTLMQTEYFRQHRRLEKKPVDAQRKLAVRKFNQMFQ